MRQKRRWFWMAYQKNWMIDPASRKRYKCWKRSGVNVKGKFQVGYDVYYDAGYAELITIEDKVWIASRSLILCHKRILKDYCIGDDYNSLPYQKKEVVLKRGCCIGMGSMIMPGVTVGEGAIVGAGSVVVKDVPAYTVVTGNPAIVVKSFKERNYEEN